MKRALTSLAISATLAIGGLSLAGSSALVAKGDDPVQAEPQQQTELVGKGDDPVQAEPEQQFEIVGRDAGEIEDVPGQNEPKA